MSGSFVSRLSYILRRLAQVAPMILAVVTINFLLINLAPGDPATLMAGDFADLETIERLREEFGLNEPLHVQFSSYVWKVLNFDLGYSYQFRAPVLDIVLARLPNTLILLFFSFILSMILGILLAAVSARRPNRAFDNTASSIAMLGYCLPMFWLGMMLILIFSSTLRWFPTGGMYSLRAPSEGWPRMLDIGRHLVLPALAYAAYFLAMAYRLTRAKLIEILREDYIRTARMKGLSDWSVIFRHALRNALVPVIAVMGLDFGVMIGGAVVVETVFSWPGVGRLMYESILSRDYPLLLGIFVIVSFGIILVNLIADLICAMIDPRIAYG
ncbi:ABC transporter permease [Silicimonas algicola]|uniref:Peptide/nickel transport system permease protein n=1 Tax=Silicimonas algicola TaxID=1826607 RepID=A0A316FYD4_9RHOB|nr:ABC transporter permease [Silicimonas algicola]AZQ68310.1 ABC transporter permease [Silicimonas algicola]PWK52716.1 peptide/nickel transport system permease protein [Silicimonas algicola]